MVGTSAEYLNLIIDIYAKRTNLLRIQGLARVYQLLVVLPFEMTWQL